MSRKKWIASGAAASAIAALACATAPAAEVKALLGGAEEVPPVQTSATGEARLNVADDGAVSGTLTVTGMDVAMAHIHVGAPGKNGPAIVKFVKDGQVYRIAPGSKLDADQLKSFKAGELYVNVHSGAHMSGEIRAQLK